MSLSPLQDKLCNMGETSELRFAGASFTNKTAEKKPNGVAVCQRYAST